MAQPPQQIQKYYEFIFNNHLAEDEKEHGLSTASDFTVDCQINLSPLIFLRSTNAQMCLKHFHVDSAPLSLLENERIRLDVTVPTNIVTANRKFHAIEVRNINKKPFEILTDNYIATNTKDATLRHINSMLNSRVNIHLLWRFAGTAFDIDVFKPAIFEKTHQYNELALTSDDIRLLFNYSAITNYTRRKYLEILSDYVPVPTMPAMKFNELYTPLVPVEETMILDKSSILKTSTEIADHLKLLASPPLIHFSLFYGIDLSKPSSARDALDAALSTHYKKTLKLMLLNLRSLSGEDKQTIRDHQKSHIALINHVTSVESILTVERARLTQDRQTTSLLQTDFLQIEQIAGRATFNINNQLLPRDNTTVKITLPESVSYALGSRTRQDQLVVGEISYDTDTQATRQRFTNSDIKTKGDRLYTPIKNHPNLIYICTDLLSESAIFKSHTKPTKFPHFNALHVERICEDTLLSNTIYKCPTEMVYHRILRTYNQLSSLRILLLDEYWQQVFFPLKSRVTGCLKIQSTEADD